MVKEEVKKRLSSLPNPAPPEGCVSTGHAQTIVTLNASTTTPDALIIPVTAESIPNTPWMSLVDLGSSDSFINMVFVEKCHLAAYTIPSIRLCLIDGTCNSIITQAIKLHIHFSSGKKQHMMFYVMPVDLSCTLVLGYTGSPYTIHQLTGLRAFHVNPPQKSTPIVPLKPKLTASVTIKPEPTVPVLSPTELTNPGKP